MEHPRDPGGPGLPPSAAVDVGALATLFDERRNSHSFLLFFALLDRLEAADAEGTAPLVHIDDLVVRALALAWHPHFTFRLSFGRQDRIGAVLDELPEGFRAAPVDEDPAELGPRIREALGPPEIQRLGRYVLRRLVRPFFVAELRALRDAKLSRRLIVLARERLRVVRPLYKLERGRQVLEIDPAWLAYLREHAPIVRGWASWRWLLHMQERNPGVLNVAAKLFPPARRTEPEAALRLFHAAHERAALRCLYSGAPLDDFALDHFLPWTFVGHDQPWNLVPVAPRALSAKGERVPDLGLYLGGLAERHAAAIAAAREALPRAEFAALAEPYLAELRIRPELVLGDAPKEWLSRALEVAFEETLRPLEALARRQGFETGWRWTEVA